MKNISFVVALLVAGFVLPGCMPCCKRKAHKVEHKDHAKKVVKKAAPKKVIKKAADTKKAAVKTVKKHAQITLEKADNLVA